MASNKIKKLRSTAIDKFRLEFQNYHTWQSSFTNASMIFILLAATALPVRPSASTTVGIKNSEPATAASVRPTTSMTVGTKSTETATHPPVKPTASTTDARGPSGLTNSEKAGIIGGCIGFGFVIAITVIFICYIYRKRKNSSGK